MFQAPAVAPFTLVGLMLLAGCVGSAPGPDEVLEIETPEALEDVNDTIDELDPSDPRIIGRKPVELIFGGSTRSALIKVLLIPPAHGDLGNPVNGPKPDDYLQATLRGIRYWEKALAAFADEYPEYAHIKQIKNEVEIYDGKVPSFVGYDIVVVYLETSGPAFRGAATNGLEPDAQTQAMIDDATDGKLRATNRLVLLSLLASAPRAGQQLPDYPELTDLESVTMHEFAHVYGLGHTTTWTKKYGPDLMNSPYALIFGDGNPVGDGGERTPRLCPSTLDMYAMAHLYRWLPVGKWQGSSGELETDLPFKLYC